MFDLLIFACKGRIKKLDKACVDLTAFRASVLHTQPMSHLLLCARAIGEQNTRLAV